MPTESEINWGEHRPGIKGRNIFRMILDSSSKLHTVSMRLLFIILTCLAASCLAQPPLKQKRDILPGDPRYDTDHHHQDENVIKNSKSYKAPENTYGPPGYQPGTPLSNSYLSPAASDSTQQPVSSYGVPQTVSEEVKTVTSTVSLPVEDKPASVEPPSASYGVPLAKTVKTTSETNSRVKSTVKTEVHEHQQVAPQAAKAVPAVQEVAHYTGVNSVPAVTTTLTKNVDSNLFAQALPNYYSPYNVPNYDVSSYAPSAYSGYQQSRFNSELNSGLSSGFSSYDTVPSVYSGFGANYPLTSAYHGNLNLPLSYQFTKTLPTAYTYPRLIDAPKTTLHFPYSLTKVVHQPFAPVQNLPVQQVHSVKEGTPVQHTVQSVETPVQQSVHSVQPVVTHTKTVIPVQTVSQPVKTHQPVKSVAILQPPVQSSQTYHTVTEVKSHTVPVGQSQNQKGFFDDIFSNIGSFLPQAPSFPLLPNFPSLTDIFQPPTPSQEDPIDEVSPSNVHSAGHVKGTVVASTPASQVKNEYVQPTAANGGYVY